jgi:hypothetical protein
MNRQGGFHMRKDALFLDCAREKLIGRFCLNILPDGAYCLQLIGAADAARASAL